MTVTDAEFEALQRQTKQIADLLDTLKTRDDILSGPFQDWGNNPGVSITGWVSFTVKSIWVKKAGKIVFVNFMLFGTSNSANTNFTVPYTKGGGLADISLITRGYDNGVMSATRLVELYSNVVFCYPGPSGGSWAASGQKSIQGQFFYSVA